MSTWFSSFSLPSPFKNDDEEEEEDNDTDHQHNPNCNPNLNSNSSGSPTAGVKNDLSALSQTFSNHLRGVAAFLAPPPTLSSQLSTDQISTTASSVEPGSPSSEAVTGIKNDLVEIGGSFKSLLSSSSNKAVTGISKFASNLLQFHDGGHDEEDDYQELQDVVGIAEEVVGFAREVSLRPELWSDFPLSLPNDFNMSETQVEHTTTIEQLVPDIATMRQKFCGHLSNGQFWMIYFVLLLPRLEETSTELLSSSEIVQVRETLLQNLQNKRTTGVGTSESAPPNASEVDVKENITQGDSTFPRKDASPKIVNTEGEIREVKTGKFEASSENEVGPGRSGNAQKHSEDMEDVSFSDLEDEGNDLSDRLSAQRQAQSARVSSGSESNEWVGVRDVHTKAGSSTVRGKDSEGEESSSDWFAVDDVDSDSTSAV